MIGASLLAGGLLRVPAESGTHTSPVRANQMTSLLRQMASRRTMTMPGVDILGSGNRHRIGDALQGYAIGGCENEATRIWRTRRSWPCRIFR
jgi:hypothetical protein